MLFQKLSDLGDDSTKNESSLCWRMKLRASTYTTQTYLMKSERDGRWGKKTKLAFPRSKKFAIISRKILSIHRTKEGKISRSIFQKKSSAYWILSGKNLWFFFTDLPMIIFFARACAANLAFLMWTAAFWNSIWFCSDVLPIFGKSYLERELN